MRSRAVPGDVPGCARGFRHDDLRWLPHNDAADRHVTTGERFATAAPGSAARGWVRGVDPAA
jgi:hypothetical protein